MIGLFKSFLRQLQLQHATLFSAAEDAAVQPLEVSNLLTEAERKTFVSGLAALRGEFKQAFGARCEEAVGKAFGGQHGVPHSSEIEALCVLLKAELSSASADEALLQLAVDTTVETVGQFCGRISQTMGRGAEAYQLSGHVNNTQMLDVHRFNAMSAMHWHVANTMRPALLSAVKELAASRRDSSQQSQYAFASPEEEDNPSDADAEEGQGQGMRQVAALSKVEAEVEAAATALLEPLFASMGAALESKLFAVHKQKFGETARGATASEIQGSEYMAEFAKHAAMVAKLLSRYDSGNAAVRAHTVALISRLVAYMTRHLALVGTYRSVPEAHLQLLATDVAQFTLGISGIQVRRRSPSRLPPALPVRGLTVAVRAQSLKLPELAASRQACAAFKELLFYNHTEMARTKRPSLNLLARLPRLTGAGCDGQVANAHKLTSLPIVTVVDFAFTLAPSDVVHPYTVRGEDLETYSRKLDSQADEELWAASKAYLQRHAKAVARNPELGAPPTPEADARRAGGLTRPVLAAAKGMQAVLDVGLAAEAAKAKEEQAAALPVAADGAG